jgi:XapX domain-containing protein
MREVMLSLCAGIFAGAVFSMLGFPIPAPITIGGFMGIFGVYMGGVISQKIKSRLMKEEAL